MAQRMKFLLEDETRKAQSVRGTVDAFSDGLYIDFAFHKDYTGDTGALVAVQLFNDELYVLVFADPESDEPTHKISLDQWRRRGMKDWKPRA